MKLKNRLIIAFLVILCIPMLMTYICLNYFNNYQQKVLYDSYGVKAESDKWYELNNINLFDSLTAKANKIVCDEIEKNKDKFLDVDYLEKLDKKLEKNQSFLIVRVEDKIIYVDSDNNFSYDLLKQLPGYGSLSVHEDIRLYTGKSTSCLINQNDIEFNDKTKGTVFVITPINTIPQIEKVRFKFVLSILAIILITAIALFIWTYRSIISRVDKLKEAANLISSGKLDYELEISGNDEIGELGRDFEEMRFRLKHTAEERIRMDEENKKLISNISHDLRTPLTSIKGYVEGLHDGVASSPEKIDKYLKTIYNKVNDMERLLDELNFYSKINTDKIPYNFKPINVVEYFNDCYDELKLEFDSDKVEINLYDYCLSDVRVIADAEQMKRVINNIISNSVKYMKPPKCTINIRINELSDFVQIEIEDDGKGIDSKDLPYIFDRFYRTDKARTSSKGGNGIGLSIVHKIIEDHGGQVWATSKLNTGTIMHIALRKYINI